MAYDQETIFHRIWNETMGRLDSYSKRVSEGRDVMAALDFARYVLWSGLIPLCRANGQSFPQTVDGLMLQQAAEDLQTKCHDYFRSNGVIEGLHGADLRTVHEKLDTLAGYVSRLVVGPVVQVAPLPNADDGLRNQFPAVLAETVAGRQPVNSE